LAAVAEAFGEVAMEFGIAALGFAQEFPDGGVEFVVSLVQFGDGVFEGAAVVGDPAQFAVQGVQFLFQGGRGVARFDPGEKLPAPAEVLGLGIGIGGGYGLEGDLVEGFEVAVEPAVGREEAADLGQGESVAGMAAQEQDKLGAAVAAMGAEEVPGAVFQVLGRIWMGHRKVSLWGVN